MSIVAAELSEAWTLRRRSGVQMMRPATTYRLDLETDETEVPAAATTAAGRAQDFRRVCKLTDREIEVLQLAATGATDRDIADALFISRRTVTSHMASILFKLNVGNRTAAAVIAARAGLIM